MRVTELVIYTCDRFVGNKVRCGAEFRYSGDESSARSAMVMAGWRPGPPFDRCPQHVGSARPFADG